jgi:hypothetical protein
MKMSSTVSTRAVRSIERPLGVNSGAVAEITGILGPRKRTC